MKTRFLAADGDPYRYGVYLRPDPATCAAVATVTWYVRAQYGLVSAGAFPPHATLIGSQHLPMDEDIIVQVVTEALKDRSGFVVHNNGFSPQGIGLGYDIHHLEDRTTPNQDLIELAAEIHTAIEPFARPAPNPDPHTFEKADFRAHLSLVSHDLYTRPDLHSEVTDFIRGLPVTYPEQFRADLVTLYRTHSDDWTGRWWTTLTWEHLHSWRI